MAVAVVVIVIFIFIVLVIVVVVGITVAVGGGDAGIIVAAFAIGVAVGDGNDVVVAVVAGNMTGNFYFRTADFFSLVVSHQASEKLCSTVFHRKWMIYRILATTEAQLGERR